MSDQAQGLRKLAKRVGRGNKGRPAPSAISGTRVVAVTSGKGGVGKTNLAVNLALALKEQGQRVLLFDADLGLANVDVILGIFPTRTLSDVIKNQLKLEDVILPVAGIKLVAGGSGVEELLELPLWQLERFLGELQQVDVGDFVLIDTGAGISRQVLGFVLAAADIIVVTTPEPTAMTDAYALLKVIASKNREARIRLVVNRVANAQEARQVFSKLQQACHDFLGVPLQELGYIVEDPSIVQAVKRQEPFLLSYPRAPASVCVHRLAQDLLMPEREHCRDDLTGFFQRLFNLFR